ncbi:MAG: flotillin-like protein FloA [bacterium]
MTLWGFLTVVGLLAAAVVGIVFLFYGWLMVRAVLCGVWVGPITMIGMQFRGISPRVIVNAMIKGAKAGLSLDMKALQSHYQAGGDVTNVVRALIAADRSDIPLDYEDATAIDLAGRDVLEAVKISVLPKVIDCPTDDSRKEFLEAVAQDGIQIKAKARVTVRANIEELVGGANEETIVARVGEGIVTSIGSAETHKEVLANPDRITREVQEKGLDANTAFNILSIDIGDIDVGRNVGAHLQADQAEADVEVAQAEAEERRAMAEAREQEMAAKVRENEAEVMKAKARVPQSIGKALSGDNLSIMDYYELKNIQADTDMRQSISGSGNDSENDSFNV